MPESAYPNQSGNVQRNQGYTSEPTNICTSAPKVSVYITKIPAIQGTKNDGRKHYLVMNNVANKLLRMIFTVIHSGKPFNLARITLDPMVYAILKS